MWCIQMNVNNLTSRWLEFSYPFFSKPQTCPHSIPLYTLVFKQMNANHVDALWSCLFSTINELYNAAQCDRSSRYRFTMLKLTVAIKLSLSRANATVCSVEKCPVVLDHNLPAAFIPPHIETGFRKSHIKSAHSMSGPEQRRSAKTESIMYLTLLRAAPDPAVCEEGGRWQGRRMVRGAGRCCVFLSEWLSVRRPTGGWDTGKARFYDHINLCGPITLPPPSPCAAFEPLLIFRLALPPSSASFLSLSETLDLCPAFSSFCRFIFFLLDP